MPDAFNQARAILEAWASMAGHDLEELYGRSRDPKVVELRQDAMLIAYEQAHLSSIQVGRLFGGRDHSTVLHALGRARARRADVDPTVAKWCPGCRTQLPLAAFNRRRDRGDGRQSYCRECQREQASRRRKAAGMGPEQRRLRGEVASFKFRAPADLMATLRATSAHFGVSQVRIVERAIRRELRRMWTVCRSCQERPKVEGSDQCGPCIAARLRVAS